MAAISRQELLRLAKTGAGARVKELQEELESIFETFPDLRPSGARRAKTPAAATSKPATGKRAASRAWSPAARKAVSDRMKKYWAAKRAKGSRTV